MPIAAPMPQLERKATKALAWNAIIDWPLPEVLSIARQAGIAPHIAQYMELPASEAPTASCPLAASPQQGLLLPGSWPPPLAHCGEPLLQPTDEWVPSVKPQTAAEHRKLGFANPSL